MNAKGDDSDSLGVNSDAEEGGVPEQVPVICNGLQVRILHLFGSFVTLLLIFISVFLNTYGDGLQDFRTALSCCFGGFDPNS